MLKFLDHFLTFYCSSSYAQTKLDANDAIKMEIVESIALGMRQLRVTPEHVLYWDTHTFFHLAFLFPSVQVSIINKQLTTL